MEARVLGLGATVAAPCPPRVLLLVLERRAVVAVAVVGAWPSSESSSELESESLLLPSLLLPPSLLAPRLLLVDESSLQVL